MITATIIGRLGADAQTRTVGDRTVTSVNVASTTRVGREERTTWITASIWGKRGEAFAQYHKKGSQCALTGSLTVREYEHNGERRKSVELDVRDWTFCGGKRERNDESGDSFGTDVPF